MQLVLTMPQNLSENCEKYVENRCITCSRARRQRRYLDDEWAKSAVHHDVEAEDLEAGAAADVARKARTIVVSERRVCRDECLDDDVVDVGPQSSHVVAVTRQPTVHRRYPPAPPPIRYDAIHDTIHDTRYTIRYDTRRSFNAQSKAKK